MGFRFWFLDFGFCLDFVLWILAFGFRPRVYDDVENPSSGLPGLDQVLKGLLPGDNVVWQVEAVEHYQVFVKPFCEKAVQDGRSVVYFRFAQHPPLVAADSGVEVRELHPGDGLESFIAEIHDTIERVGQGGVYVFDLLSELATQWYSDRLLANFIQLTCPYLYDVGAIAYCAVLRGYHSSEALSTISETAQITIDVFGHGGVFYVHPLKVQQRYSPTMHMLHMWKGAEFTPVTNSVTIAEIRNSVPWRGMDPASASGVWNRALLEADTLLKRIQQGEKRASDAAEMLDREFRMVFSRDQRVLRMARRYFSLADMVAIRRRVIGSGLLGGKSVGMLLARAILRHADPRWTEILEPHDSFFIGSDVFYTFIVRNGLWWVRQRQRDKVAFLEGAERARQRMLVGEFPGSMMARFQEILDYFGQSPIIVRSSSLLEDAFGNSFAGKYDSVFCANQGSRHKRLEGFLSAVRTVYASTMSEAALAYRAQRGLLERDEQMALLVQRVSGCAYGPLFYPQLAGVGLSYNPYVWDSSIDPEHGVLRMVFGLGTRAVDRCDDDYTRVVALGAPERRVESSRQEVRTYAQRRVDVIDLNANRLASYHFPEVVKQSTGLEIETFASRDEALERRTQDGDEQAFPWVLTFEQLLSKTPLVKHMRDILQTLHQAYDYPVDIEFTANFTPESGCRINLLQCRPLQVKGGGTVIPPPPEVAKPHLILEAHGKVIGHSRAETLGRLIYVVPGKYAPLPLQKKYSVARLLGRILHLEETQRPKTILLAGPGRWGSTAPALGVPVNFAEINSIAALCEIAAMHAGLVPDVSLGTHFFNELVEMDILYVALEPDKKGDFLNEEWLLQAHNRLAELLPSAAVWADCLRVIDPAGLPGAPRLKLNADLLKQRVVCYLET